MKLPEHDKKEMEVLAKKLMQSEVSSDMSRAGFSITILLKEIKDLEEEINDLKGINKCS